MAAHNQLRVRTSHPLQPQTGAERARARLRVCWKLPPRLAHPCRLEVRLWQEFVPGRAQGPHPLPLQAAPSAVGVSPVGAAWAPRGPRVGPGPRSTVASPGSLSAALPASRQAPRRRLCSACPFPCGSGLVSLLGPFPQLFLPNILLKFLFLLSQEFFLILCSVLF